MSSHGPAIAISTMSASRTKLTRSPWLLACGIVLLGVFWFSTIGVRALVSPDEGRYASISLAMLQSGDWVTPRLDGLLYFEKPALQYWLGAIAFHLFGISEFSARLWPALAGFLTVLVTGFTAMKLWGRECGALALAICASMTWIVGNSFYLTLDSGLNLWVTLSLCAMLLAHREALPAEARARRNWILVAWAAMALAVLTKGLVGIVIPGATLVLYCIWQRDVSWWRGMHWMAGLLILFAIAAPWFVLVSMRHPAFAEFFFVHEHFSRFLTKVHRREGAWWYYVPILLAGTLPWTVVLAYLGLHCVRATTTQRATRGTTQGALGDESVTQDQVRVLIVWSAFVFVFFSLSGSKLPSYILPMFPALSLLMAAQLRGVSPVFMRWQLSVPAALWLLAALAATQVHRFAKPSTPVSVLEPMAHAVEIGACLFFGTAAIAWLLLRRNRLTQGVLCIAVGHLLAITLVFCSHDSFGQLKSAREPARALAPYLDADTPVFAVRTYDQTLPFYLRRNVVLVGYVDEFELGQRLEPGKSIADLDQFANRWTQLPKAAAYMSEATLQELQRRGLHMRVAYRDPRRVVVIKP